MKHLDELQRFLDDNNITLDEYLDYYYGNDRAQLIETIEVEQPNVDNESILVRLLIERQKTTN